MTSLRPLRPHQQAAIDGLRQSIASGHRSPMLQLSTGAGKTVIAAHIVDGAMRKNKRVAFCVPSIGLIDQTFERFIENGIDAADMGVMQGDHPWRRPHAPIQIATAQTLARRDLPKVDVTVIDEAHERHEVYERWMRQDERPLFIGLSATPWAKGLGKLYDDLIKPTDMQSLIDAGYLAPFKVYAPDLRPDLSLVRTVAGDYHEGDLSEAMNRDELVADVVSTWLLQGNNQPTLCFATSRAHAQALHDRFVSAGVTAAYVDANTPREERTHIGRQLADGAIKVVCNIGTLTKGIDWDVRCLILARPTKSHMLFVQIVGRALRTADGKSHAIILDHSDTHLRLGMVTDIDFDELDMGRKPVKGERKVEKTVPLPVECHACNGLMPAKASACPCCGAEKPKPAFAEQDGELVEMVASGKPKPGAGGLKVVDQIRLLGHQAVWAQLSHFADERGRGSGWVYHRFRDVFQGDPPSWVYRKARAEPGPLVRSWIRSRDIAWIKRQKAA